MSELVYRLALTMVPLIGDAHAKILVERFGNAQAIFKAKLGDLALVDGIGELRAAAIRSFRNFGEAEKELRFVEKNAIELLFIGDDNYPKRLLHCIDAPTLLFYKGSADLNATRVIAIVGTRSYTDYGRQVTEKLVADLADQGVMIVSGLAYGIDAIAHKASLRHSLPTIGVVGHGMGRIYPPDHQGLAMEMVQGGGGLLTEFWSSIKPDRHNFPLRNRIVAGMSDATVVVETQLQGGSMITAKLADSYNRDVFAIPGKTTDKLSAGCNYLIRNNRATLLTEAADLLQTMGWIEKKKPGARQRQLFTELSGAEEQLVKLIGEKEPVSIDEINFGSGMSTSEVAASILNLEMMGLIASLPGKRYRLA